MIFSNLQSLALLHSQLALRVLLSDVRQWAITPIRRLILGCLIIALLWKGIFFYLFTLLVYDSAPRSPFSVQMIKPYLSTAYPVAQDEARAISFLRTRLGPSDIVYRAKDKLEPYAIWAGLPTQASVYTADSGDDDAYGLGAKKFAARESLSSISGSWLDRLGAEHVTWVVTDPTDVAINLTLECPEGRSRAILAAQFGQIKAFRLQ